MPPGRTGERLDLRQASHAEFERIDRGEFEQGIRAVDECGCVLRFDGGGQAAAERVAGPFQSRRQRRQFRDRPGAVPFVPVHEPRTDPGGIIFRHAGQGDFRAHKGRAAIVAPFFQCVGIDEP